MRSNKELWLRGAAAVAWIGVVACAAYAFVLFTRNEPEDFGSIERIAVLTPKYVSCGIGLDGGSETWEVRDDMMIDGFGIFFPPRIQLGPPRRLIPRLTRVGNASIGAEIARGSELEKMILACLDRAIESGRVDVRSLQGMRTLRARLAGDEFSQDPRPQVSR